MTFIVDGTNGLTFPNSTTQASAGRVLQVVQTSLGGSGVWASSSSTPSDIGLSATITPTSSTSKILCIVQLTQVNSQGTNTTGGAFKLVRNSTDIVQFETAISYTTASGESDNYIGGTGTSYLDTPASTSVLTYKIQGWRSNGSGTMRLSPAGPGNSSIILMEIGT